MEDRPPSSGARGPPPPSPNSLPNREGRRSPFWRAHTSPLRGLGPRIRLPRPGEGFDWLQKSAGNPPRPGGAARDGESHRERRCAHRLPPPALLPTARLGPAAWGILALTLPLPSSPPEEGFIPELLCLYLSGLAGTLGCVCSRTFDSALQGKGELTTRRGAREDHFLQIGRQEASFQKHQVFSVPPHPLDTPPPGKVCERPGPRAGKRPPRVPAPRRPSPRRPSLPGRAHRAAPAHARFSAVCHLVDLKQFVT